MGNVIQVEARVFIRNQPTAYRDSYDQYNRIRQWCKLKGWRESVDFWLTGHIGNNGIAGSLTVYFAKEDDALVFKLGWYE